MITQITIRASENDFSRYRSLVDSDWNKSTLDQVMTLMGESISIPQNQAAKHPEVLGFLGKKNGDNKGEEIPNQILGPLTFLSGIFREPSIPKVPNSLFPVKNKAVFQMIRTVRFLLLQLFVDIRGDIGFFQDLQSLLFLHGVHYLLPHLRTTGLDKEHDSLLNAMHIHAFVVWRNEPSHMFYLLGSMMGYLENKKARLGYLEKSQAATPIDDHSFLTRANAYWAELLELGEKDKAMDYLLRISRLSPPAYIQEIEDMIKETAAYDSGSKD